MSTFEQKRAYEQALRRHPSADEEGLLNSRAIDRLSFMVCGTNVSSFEQKRADAQASRRYPSADEEGFFADAL